MSNDRRIDATEDNDQHGGYIIRGGGEWAGSLAELAAKLGAREDQLNFQRNPELGECNRRIGARRRMNSPEAIRARCDFDVFDPHRE